MLAGFADEISVALAGKTAVTIIKGWTLSDGKGGVQFLRRGGQFHRLRFHRLGRGAAAALAATRCGALSSPLVRVFSV